MAYNSVGVNLSQPSVPILRGIDNYDIWSVKMKTLFLSQELWDFVENGYNETASAETLKDLLKKDNKALFLIQQAVDDAIFPRISAATKAKVAWDILHTNYQGVEKVVTVKLQTLRRKFDCFVMKDSESMHEYFNRVMEVVNQMRKYGERLSDQKVVEKILRSLPKKYESAVAAIEESKNLSTLTIDELMGSLQSHEDRHRGYEEDDVEKAFHAKLQISKEGENYSNDHNNRGGHSLHGRRGGRGNRGGGRAGGQSQNYNTETSKGENRSRNFTCYNCGKQGHIAKYCRQKGNQANLVEQENKDECESLFLAALATKECDSNVWYMDSASSKHVTANLGAFVCLDKSFKSNVKMADGTIRQAHGKGIVKLNDCEIKDVLYVPDLDSSLLSVGQFMRKGYSLLFEDFSCSVFSDATKKNMLFRVPMSDNNMFPLDLDDQQKALAVSLEDDDWLWHHRYGHLNFTSLSLMSKTNLVDGLPVIHSVDDVCESCVIGKHHRDSFPKGKSRRASQTAELIHADVCGPMRTSSLNGSRYFVVFVDDYSRMTWVFFLKNKSEVLPTFKKFRSVIEKQSGNAVKILRTDRGGEFVSAEFDKLCEDFGIQRQLTASYTPQQNGVAERKNRSLVEMAKSMLKAKNLPKSFWAEAIHTAAYILNRSSTSALSNQTPFEAWNGWKPKVKHFKIFGCVAYVLVPSQKRGKLDENSVKCIFVGYSMETKGYRFYDPLYKKLIISRDVIFDEKSEWSWSEMQPGVHFSQNNEEFIPEQIQNEGNNGGSDSSSPNTPISSPSSSTSSSSSSTPPRKWRSLQEVYEQLDECHLVVTQEPSSFEEATKIIEWQKAMDEEMDALEKNKTWELVDLPFGKEVVGLKWVYKVKHKPDGSIQRHKARLVARGYMQREGVDFEETFSPVARFDTIRATLSIAAYLNWKVFQFDVKSAFLNGILEEEVYVQQPKGYEISGEEKKVYRLKKALYGLKQAPRAWYGRIDSHFCRNGFQKSASEPTLYVKRKADNEVLIICLYVDDLIYTGNSIELSTEFKKIMVTEFDMTDLGLMSYFLGLEVSQGKAGIFFSQQKYVNDLLTKFNMKDCNSVTTPMITNHKYCLDDGEEKVDSQLYRSLVGSLLYLTNSRPDILQATSLLSRFMQSPSKVHFGAAKRVLRYLKGTSSYGLFYSSSDNFKLYGFSDSDWAGSLDDRRSTTGYLFLLGSSAISWSSRKQPSTALSSSEAEYMAVTSATCQAIWLRRILQDMKFEQKEATVIYCDNQSTISMAKNPVHHQRTRHIDIRHHFIREQVAEGSIQLEFCNSREQVADLFTKALPLEKFAYLRDKLQVIDFCIKEEYVR